ncbi:MAG: SEL1-like repeat protein [Bacteroidales bacterium]|nr:SEL1-like repeat protein [Bacteroidales bacterium]
MDTNNKVQSRAIVLIIILLLTSSVVVAQDYESMPMSKLTEMAQKGDAGAQAQLGYRYCFALTDSETADLDKAKFWLMKAIAQGNTDAITNLNSLGDQFSEEGRYDEALQCYRKSADMGCVEAQYSIGYCYDKGNGVEQDNQKAKEWYRKAIAQGNTDAKWALQWLEEKEEDEGEDREDTKVEVAPPPQTDEEKFAEWLEFANNGKAWAQNNVGWAYENGFGVAKNMAKAIEWYQKAANNGEANAQRNLGICYEHGHGVAVDKQKALYWYKVAMDNGNDKATDGYNNLVGQAGTPEEKFAVWLKQAEAGNIGAQCNVGWAYQNGFGVAKNESKAIEWYQKSANQGESVAQCNLGICYEAGLGVPQNIAKAKEWYQKSANQGNQTAQSCLNRLNQPQTAQVQQQQNRGGGFWNGLLGLMEATSQVLTAYDQYKNPQAYYNTSGDYGDNSYAGSSSGTSSGSSYDEGIAREKNRQSDLEAKAKAREIERDKNNVTFWRDQLLQKYRRCVSELESMKRHKERNRSKRERLQDEMREIRQEARSRGVKPPIQKNSIEDWDGDVND